MLKLRHHLPKKLRAGRGACLLALLLLPFFPPVASSSHASLPPPDRLKEIVYPDKTVAYTLDAAGNRLTEKATTGATVTTDRTYAYSPNNQLLQITDHLDASKNASFSHDQNGNMVSKTVGGMATDYLYDSRNLLVSVKRGASTLALFAYDAEGRRREKVGLDGLVRYVYDGQRVLLETTNLGETVTKYDWGADRPISLTHATQGRQYFHQDAMGSVTNLTTATGYIQATYQLDAWGNSRKTLGTSVNVRLFTGKERDVETGLYYFGARYYDPETGRFITEDPYWGDSATPPSLHRYLYAYGNPVRYVDLYGYLTWDDVTDMAALFAGGVAGSAVSIVFGATELAGLGLDIMGTELYYQSSGLLGRESYERTTALTEGLARALANPVGTARAIGEHYGKEADLAAQEYAEGRSFTAGVVGGKNLFDLYMLVRALPEVARVAGVAKTGSALAAEGEAAASSARQAVRDAAKIAEEGSQGPALVPVEAPAVLRARVLNAVEESAAARSASRFEEYAARERVVGVGQAGVVGVEEVSTGGRVIIGPAGPGQFLMKEGGLLESATVVRRNEFVNRMYDSAFGTAPGVSGPMGRSFSPGSGIPTTAADGIRQRGLNIYFPNNAQQAIIYRATRNIPATSRISLSGSTPEILIDPSYWEYLQPVWTYQVVP